MLKNGGVFGCIEVRAIMKQYYCCYFKLANSNCPYEVIEADSLRNALKICDIYFANHKEIDYICFWNVEVDYPFGWYYRDGKWKENEMIPEYSCINYTLFEEYHKKRNWERFKERS